MLHSSTQAQALFMSDSGWLSHNRSRRTAATAQWKSRERWLVGSVWRSAGFSLRPLKELKPVLSLTLRPTPSPHNQHRDAHQTTIQNALAAHKPDCVCVWEGVTVVSKPQWKDVPPGGHKDKTALRKLTHLWPFSAIRHTQSDGPAPNHSSCESSHCPWKVVCDHRWILRQSLCLLGHTHTVW